MEGLRGKTLAELDARYAVRPIEAALAMQIVETCHYMRRRVRPVSAHGLINKAQGKVVGVVLYSTGIGSTVRNSICGEAWGSRAIELARLCVDDGERDYPTSYFLSRSLSMLARPRIVYSFADPAYGHTGKIYQADNWLYCGMTQAGKHKAYLKQDGSLSHSRSLRRLFMGVKERVEKVAVDITPKHRYVKLLGSRKDRRAMGQALRFEVQPYPAGETARTEVPRFDEMDAAPPLISCI